jgi:hypothetical protein
MQVAPVGMASKLSETPVLSNITNACVVQTVIQRVWLQQTLATKDGRGAEAPSGLSSTSKAKVALESKS